MKRYSIFLVMYMVLMSLLPSCTDKQLDVEPRDRLTDDNVWTDPGAADLFLNDIYTGLPDGNTWYDPLENWSDNAICGFAWPRSRTLIQQSLQSAVDADISSDLWGLYNWETQYTNIRKCNIFIKNVTTSEFLSDDYKTGKMAEARFLRAYFYHNLWMAFGGIPIITDVLDVNTQGDEVYRPRNTSEETFQFIKKEMEEIYENLPAKPSSGKIGKGAALFLKGWCELFSEKWIDAAASYKRIIDELEYRLDPDYAALFLSKGAESKESILYREYAPPGRGKGGNHDGLIGPTFTKGGAETSWGGMNPTQDLVDDYAMTNGKTITDPTSGYNPQKPYENREKRFYQSIVYDGSYFYNDTIYTRKGIGSKNEIDLNDRDDATQTGYYPRKRMATDITLGAASWDGFTSYQNYILFRYGEVLLNYAEAQNEVVGPDATVYGAINQVRERSSLPALPAGLNKEAMRTAIRRERRVELAFEDKRYWDLIRWHIAEVNLNRPLKGMLITVGTGGVLNYSLVNAVGGDRKFAAAKNYLFPIPQNVLDQNPKLQGHQNNGY